MKKNLLSIPVVMSADAPLGGGGSSALTEKPAEPETLEQKNARLEAENAQLRENEARRLADEAAAAADEAVIQEKMSKGLTRSQASGVVRRQKEYGVWLEKQYATRRPRIIDILRRFKCTTGEVSYKCRLEIRKTVSQEIVLPEIVAAQNWLAAQASSPPPAVK